MTNSARPITLYNPHLLAKDELIAGFIARQPLLDALVDDLRRGGGQHHLLIGSRGTGKTTLLLRLGLALDDDPALAKRAIALRFPEEQYNIIRPSDFWLNCLDALVDALERRAETDEARRLDALIEETDDLDDEDTRAERALGHLTAWARRARKLVVLLVDNLDLVLDRLRESHWALRKVLSGDKHLVLVGASSSAVPETFEYGQAFYDFFNVHELGGLDDDEARRVLVRLSEVLGTPQVTRAITDDPGRLKSLLLLSGGTPRTLQLLHGVLAEGSSDTAEHDIERMVDHVTPYYKARFEDLPAQGQQIVDAVALHWHPMTAIECADKTRLDVTIVSAQLTRLVRQGVIAKVPHGSGKLAFQLAERFFGVWYMMRASRRLRRKLFWLAVSVQQLYGHDEFERQAAALLASSADPAKLLAFAEASLDAAVKRRLKRRAVSLLVLAGEQAPQWQGIDLNGEDQDLKEDASWAHLIQAIHKTIEQHMRLLDDKAARHCADAVAEHPALPLITKIFLAEQLESGDVRAVETIRSIQPPQWVPASLRRAIRGAEAKSFSDATSIEDVDDILIHFDTASRSEALGFMAGLADESASAYAFSMCDERNASYAIIASLTYARLNWTTAVTRLRRALVLAGNSSDSLWQIPFAWVSAATSGHARDAAALLHELGLHERALPLYEALRAFADGKTGELIHLAPEVRVPAEQYLAEFVRAAAPATRATSPSPAPPPPSRPRSGRRATARPGTPAPRRRTPRRP